MEGGTVGGVGMVRTVTKDDVIKKLSEIGVSYDDLGDRIHVPTPQTGSVSILTYDVKDITPVRKKVKEDIINSYTYRAKTTIKDLGFVQGIFRKICVKYRDPKILYRLIPVKLTNVHFHISEFEFEGDVVSELRNQSTEGQVGKLKILRGRRCPTSDDYYYWEYVKGSADLLANWIHNAYEENSDLPVIRNLYQRISDEVEPYTKTQIRGHFRTGGFSWSTIWDILKYFTSGTLTIRNGFDVTIKYYWKGAWQTLNQKINATVTLPVEGGVDIDW